MLEMTFLVVFCGEMAVLLMALGQVVCLLSVFFFDDENVKKAKKGNLEKSSRLHVVIQTNGRIAG